MSPGSKTSSGRSKLLKVLGCSFAIYQGMSVMAHFRTCVIWRSLIPGWYPAHEVQVILKTKASFEMSNDLDDPFGQSQLRLG